MWLSESPFVRLAFPYLTPVALSQAQAGPSLMKGILVIARRGFLALTAAGAASALAACSTGSSSDSKSSGGASGSGSAAGYPVEIKHAFGTTKITKQPTKIVCVGWGEADICASLGVVPVAAPAIVWGQNAKQSTDWYDAQVKKLGSKTTTARFADKDGTPVDKVAQYQPDLIIGTNSGMTKDVYDKLTKIAPVIAYPKVAYGTSWEDQTAMIAKALGKKDEGDKLVTDTKKKISDAVAKHSELKGKTASWIYFTPTNLNTVGIYTPLDARPRTLSEFGMKDGAGVAKLTKGSDKFFVDLSAEKAAQIDSDVVVFDSLQGADGKKVKSNALLGKIKALKNDSYYELKDQKLSAAMSIPTPLSIPVALEGFLPKLAEVAKKAK